MYGTVIEQIFNINQNQLRKTIRKNKVLLIGTKLSAMILASFGHVGVRIIEVHVNFVTLNAIHAIDRIILEKYARQMSPFTRLTWMFLSINHILLLGMPPKTR